MDWTYPQALILAIPALAFLYWADFKSSHPMGRKRRRLLLVLRSLMVLLAVIALASPSKIIQGNRQSVMFMLDHSKSEGKQGIDAIYQAANRIRASLGKNHQSGVIAFGQAPELLLTPQSGKWSGLDRPDPAITERIGAASNYERAVTMSEGLFPSGTSHHAVLIGDGNETHGSLLAAAEKAALSGLKIHTLGVGGELQPDARVSRLTASKTRLNEGASLELEALVEGSLSGKGMLRLFENGVEVDRAELELAAGKSLRHRFKRVPNQRDTYTYRVKIEGFEQHDQIPENDEALSVVDVRGKPLWLYVEGEASERHFLTRAMASEGIRLEERDPDKIPNSLQAFAGYDGIIFSDLPAHQVTEGQMNAIRDYVENLGGGFVMIGGARSFGVGGYHGTIIEDLLPVTSHAIDEEEQQNSALALVIDRSGSMKGSKLEICKSAAIATAAILSTDDFIGVYAFNSSAHEIVPMTPAMSTHTITKQIAQLNAGGGTNLYPAMVMARDQLFETRAKIKHMIVLTDGQTAGSGYVGLANQCHADGITISSISIGSGSQVALLREIAAAGGGNSYVTNDPASIPRIFTQDTMTHTGRMIQETPFEPQLAEPHPMLREWTDGQAPPLLGYVRTHPRASAQIALVTDQGDPLLAQWRYGLGKVTAFTSDSKSRWAALWVEGWSGYSHLWAQILRETSRSPQGHFMDLRLEAKGGDVSLIVDVAEDAGTRKNAATVEADLFYQPANALGATMSKLDTLTLEQSAPGIYRSSFRPNRPGAYLIRARSGSQLVSTGYIHSESSEVATGQVNEPLLKRVAEMTGGTYLESPDQLLTLTGSHTARYLELWPVALWLLLVLYFLDLGVRRWENVLGVVAPLLSIFRRRAQS